MMSHLTASFVIIALHTFQYGYTKQCKFIPPCTCSTSDFDINLEPLMLFRKDAPFQVSTDQGYTYYVHPCNKPVQESSCRNLSPLATACQVLPLPSDGPFGLGQINGNGVFGDPAENSVTFNNSYSYNSDTKPRAINLKVICSSEDSSFTFESETSLTYSFMLKTRFGCAPAPAPSSGGGLSVGSVLVILFFVILLIYLIGGLLFLKFVRKAEGSEVIPNIEFWKDFPSLVKDGIMFTFRGCKADTTYEKI
ncbi:unnamed protein product [Lymnaea stagnalis]|uniref:Cation-dependent mannose-6-phosphate receptor n=1 Tax=Lymnaea stagnalis TaxID=6523 RepID=A0AAV2HEQ4_LYMST